MNKPRILLLSNFLSASGDNRSTSEELADRLEKAGYHVLRSSLQKGRFLRLLDRTYTIVKCRREYDVAHVDVFSGPAFMWAAVACWTLWAVGKPYVLTLRGGNLPGFALRYPRRVRRLLRSAALVTAPSRYLLEQMSTYCAKILLLPNALDVYSYEFKLREHPQPRLVWLRAFGETYNPSMAPRIVASLLKDTKNIHLTMFGPDKGDGSLQRCQEAANRLDVSDRIAFPGGIEKRDVPIRLNEGDIFINTTNVDNTPVSVIEAMACGLCVVSTNVGGIPYLLDDERDALLVPPRDPEAMASAVRRVLSEPGLAGRLSLNARKKAEQFDWSCILPQWEKILGTVASGRKHG